MHGQRSPVTTRQGCSYGASSLLLAHTQRAPVCLSTFPKAFEALTFVSVLTVFKEMQKNKEKCVKWELFVPRKLILIQEMPSDMVGSRSEITALDSQAATSRGLSASAAHTVQTLRAIRTASLVRNL